MKPKNNDTMTHLTTFILSCAALLCLSAGSAAQQRLPLSLAQCREMAIAHNEDLQKAGNAARQAELDKAIALAANLPQVSGSASVSYLNDMDLAGMTLQMRGTYMAGITLVQPVYAGGKVRAANRLARIGEEAAAETLRQTRMSVIAEADNAYWTYIAVTWQVRMLQSYQAQMDTLHRQIAASLSAGMATDNDLLRVDAKRSEIRYQLQKARNGANLCRLALCSAIGCPLDTEIAPTDTVISVNRPGALDADINQRPELRLLRQQVAAAEQQVKSARADHLPQLGLSAGYLYYGNVKLKGTASGPDGTPVPYTQKLDDGIWLAMASLNVPIFHWGEGHKQVRKARLDLQNSQLDLQKNTRLLDIEARQAALNLADSYALVETATLGDTQSTENLRVMRNRYAAGMCSLTDLLDAQSQWQQARANLIEARTQHKINETEYLRVTGRLAE